MTLLEILLPKIMGERMDSNEKYSLPHNVRDTFRRLQSFGTSASAGWSVESHIKLNLFTIEDIKQNFFFSQDEGLDGDSWCCRQPECLSIVY